MKTSQWQFFRQLKSRNNNKILYLDPSGNPLRLPILPFFNFFACPDYIYRCNITATLTALSAGNMETHQLQQVKNKKKTHANVFK